MKLEVGKYYLNASGGIIQIRNFDIGNKARDMSSDSYDENGKSINHFSGFDLIAEIPKELHQYLIQTIKDYHTDLDFKATVDSVYSHS